MLRIKLEPDMTFEEAADHWLRGRSRIEVRNGMVSARHIRENTETSYRQYITSLSLFFRQMRLEEITFTHFADYQKARYQGVAPFIRKRRPHLKEPGICPAGPKKINQELGLLKSILFLAGCWNRDFQLFYEPLLFEPVVTQRALYPQEQEHWLETAQEKQRWRVVYWYSIVAFDTCMSTDELRNLRRGDIDLSQQILMVRVGKTKHRTRTIELIGPEVLYALEKLLERASGLGATEPGHYIFPFHREKQPWIPDRPMTVAGLKRLWQEVREASGLKGFRMYDTRHTGITRMAEQGVPIAVIMSFAGHISQRMSAHYTHISQAAQRKWRSYQPPTAPTHGHRVPECSPALDIMHPSIEMEISRRVALALQQHRPALQLGPGT